MYLLVRFFPPGTFLFLSCLSYFYPYNKYSAQDLHDGSRCGYQNFLTQTAEPLLKKAFVEKFPKPVLSQITQQSNIAAASVAARTSKPVQFCAAGAPEAVDAAMFKLLLH